MGRIHLGEEGIGTRYCKIFAEYFVTVSELILEVRREINI